MRPTAVMSVAKNKAERKKRIPVKCRGFFLYIFFLLEATSFLRTTLYVVDSRGVLDGSLGVSQQRHWHPSEMTCADQRVDPSLEAAEAVNIH